MKQGHRKWYGLNGNGRTSFLLSVSLSTVVLNSRDRQGNLWLP